MNKSMSKQVSADVRLEAQSSSPRTSEELEALALDVLDALLGDQLADVVIGPAVGCDFDASSIEVEFSVEVQSDADVHRTVSRVVETIGPLLGAGDFRSQTVPSKAPAEADALSC